MIEGVVVIDNWAKNFGDLRGFFRELGRNSKNGDYNLPDMVQYNLAKSSKDVVRGLHYQEVVPQGKLVQCIEGSILDVILDMRKESETFGKVQTVELNNERAVYVPPYCAHGYWSLQDNTFVHYSVTNYYSAKHDRGFCPIDTNLDLPWEGKTGNLKFSDKDKNNPYFHEVADRNKGNFNI